MGNKAVIVSASHARLLEETHCYWCEEAFNDPSLFRSNPTFDHIITLDQNGSRSGAHNLVRACEFCNNTRSNAHVYEWRIVVHDFIKPYRRDLPAMAEAMANAQGFRRYAKVVATAARRQEFETIEEVGIRRWPLAYATSEFGLAMKPIHKDFGVDWYAFSAQLFGLLDPGDDSDAMTWFDAGHGLKVARRQRLGYLDGDDLRMVTRKEWLILRSFKENPEAAEFRQRVGDGAVRVILHKVGRDHLGIMLYRGHGYPQRCPDVFLYGSSAPAVQRVYDHIQMHFLQPSALVHEHRSEPLRTRISA
ncbi:MAG: hypothetical protein EOP83_18235 [Verrucomicrobiaceae bacterium]|nr:MAG: hypothetical protein EOP83_18235 [Verrucomicrobiaceae bacterium]